LPAGRELASAFEPFSPPFGDITDHHDYELACFWASRVDDRMFWLDVMEGRQEDPADSKVGGGGAVKVWIPPVFGVIRSHSLGSSLVSRS